MKTTIVTTNDDRGGAAIAAKRLHLGLRRAGIDSTMLVRYCSTRIPGVVEASIADTPEARTHLLVAEQELRQRIVRDNRPPDADTFFSLPYPDLDLADEAVIRAADVVNVHWISNFAGPGAVRRLAARGRPVVWTLHDFRGFTGGCHYPGPCRRYETVCDACPQLAVDDGFVRAAFDDALDDLTGTALTVVTPSRWLAERAGASRILGPHDVQTIPNGIDVDVFDAHPRAATRRRLGVPDDAPLLVFGCDQLSERRKGWPDLAAALAAAARSPRWPHDAMAAVFGAGEHGDLPVPVLSLGHLEDETDVAAAYAAADLFVLPTHEDNLPNTVLEAMACHTAVLAYATGGVPEMIDDDVEGALVPTGDVDGLARALVDLVADRARLTRLGAAGRARVERCFTDRLQTQRYRALFEELMARPSAPTTAPPAMRLRPRFAAAVRTASGAR